MTTPAIERDWKSDPTTGELVIGDDIVMTSGIDSIAQDVRERLGYDQGEWFIDPADPDAIPIFNGVLVAHPNLASIRGIYEKAILGTPGVKEIVSLDLSLDRRARRLSIAFVASTDLGLIKDTIPLTVGG